MTPSITEDTIYTATRAFLLAVVPPGIEVVQSQNNRVAEPAGSSFIVMTMSNRVRLATNQNTWSRENYNAPGTLFVDGDIVLIDGETIDFGGLSGGSSPGVSLLGPDTVTIDHSVQVDMQLDIHGPIGSDIACVVVAMFLDDFGRDVLATYSLAPLAAGDGRQMPFINGEHQYENRWVLMLSMQLHPNVLIPAQFAATLSSNIVQGYS